MASPERRWDRRTAATVVAAVFMVGLLFVAAEYQSGGRPVEESEKVPPRQHPLTTTPLHSIMLAAHWEGSGI